MATHRQHHSNNNYDDENGDDEHAASCWCCCWWCGCCRWCCCCEGRVNDTGLPPRVFSLDQRLSWNLNRFLLIVCFVDVPLHFEHLLKPPPSHDHPDGEPSDQHDRAERSASDGCSGLRRTRHQAQPTTSPSGGLAREFSRILLSDMLSTCDSLPDRTLDSEHPDFCRSYS